MSTREKPSVKIICIGNSGVGKTSLQKRYIHNKFSNLYTTTIAADFYSRLITVGETEILLQIWDTAGQERFMAMSSSFYRGAHGCVLVFDTCNSASFENLNFWKEEFLKQSNIEDTENFPFVVVGTKIDKTENRQVTKEKAEEWSKENGMLYFETSAKDAINVDAPFLHIATLGFARLKNLPVIIDQPTPSNANYCCYW